MYCQSQSMCCCIYFSHTMLSVNVANCQDTEMHDIPSSTLNTDKVQLKSKSKLQESFQFEFN